MKGIRNSWRKLLLLAVSGLSLLPAPAMAQDARGKFTLPRQVRWGAVTLPAGQYSYSVTRGVSETVILHNSTGGGAIVMASTVSMADSSQAPRILLHNEGAEWFVSSMVLGTDGEELHFSAPSRGSQAVQGAESRAKLASLSKP